MKKLSPTMIEAMEYAAGRGGSVYTNRRTEDALIARGLITYDVPGRKCDLPVVTVAGWAWLKTRGIDARKARTADTVRRAVDLRW